MLKQFSKYFSIGILNTLVHWGITAGLFYFIGFSQALSNVIGFIVAVTFSYIMNAKFTFEKKPVLSRYLIFTLFMGGLSYVFGYAGDYFALNPFITLFLFSGTSLALGFLFSKFFVFR